MLLATVLFACWGQEPVQVNRYLGRRIVEVAFSPADQPLSRDQLGLLVGLRPGDTLTEKNLALAIENLYLSGRYEDIVADAELRGEVVAVTFRTTSRYFVSRVMVEGVPDPPNPGRLQSATQLDLGRAFRQEELSAAADRLLDVLRANGFHFAAVSHETTRRDATEEVDILFTVVPGERASIARPAFTGNLQMSERSLIRTTGWLKWFGLRGFKEVTENRIQTGVDNIRNAYLKKNYLESTVRLTEMDFDGSRNTLTPRLQIDSGPRVAVQTKGAKVGSGTLRELIPIYQERTIDRELLLEGSNNLVEYFQNKGFAEPRVSYQREAATASQLETIVYEIETGRKVKLVEVRIEGVNYFDQETVRERLSLTPARFPQSRRGRYSEGLVDSDKLAILSLYESNGFREAKVTSEVLSNARGKEDQIVVVLRVEEGAQWLVEDVELNGVDLRLIETVQGQILSSRGQPFSTTQVANDRDSVLNYYFNNGYLEATLQVDARLDESRKVASLRYAVTEGRRYFVRDVLINGPETTRMDLIRSRLTFQPQQPLSQSRLVESQRRLYDLGVFANVNVAVQNPEGKERSKFVVMQIDEARRYSLSLGLGAELGRIGGGSSFDAPAGTAGFSPRGLIGISRSNMFGIAHTASITARASNVQQRLLLNYIAPQFRGNDNLNLSLGTLLDRSRDVRTFSSSRVEATTQLSQRARKDLTIQYRASIRRVFVDENSLNIDPELIPVYSQPVRTTQFSSGLIQDRRDDPVDSTRGYFNTFDYGYAAPVLGGRTHYTRLIARNSTYHKIGRDVIFARTGTFGWIDNFGQELLPLPELFYSGGATTHRGFPENQAGPRDLVTGFPIGGETFLFFGHELRFPLLGRNLGGVLFHDMGNVYSSLDKLSFRYRQRDLEDFDYAVQAFGFGIRFKTPVGPVRIDLAFAPNSPRFFGVVGDRDDLISGNIESRQQRVSRFQFHFSIGQAF